MVESHTFSAEFKSDSKIILNSRLTLNILEGDLTLFASDAIVNAANSELTNGAGLAKAIRDAGNPGL